MLVARRIAGLRTGVQSVEKFRPGFQIEAESLEMFVPVGVFYDDLHLRIDPPGRFENELFSRLCEQLKAKFRPTSISLRLNALFAFTAGKKKVIQYHLIEIFRREFDDLFQFFSQFRIGIAVRLKSVALVHGDGDTP
jgi:hypothetical protein